LFRDLDTGDLLLRSGIVLLDRLEEEIGEINSERVRNELESVLTRMIAVGFMPEEAILLISKVWDLSIEDWYGHEI
jgi:hypothetical protein